MYQALYRTWRPNTFAEMVGQEHITRTISRQVEIGRFSHAYLFTGSRGTGKTSCAKILSKAVNCENPKEGNPCNICSACVGISDGSVLDVLELDAASNNGVDQVRTLRDEAIYSPASVKMRVYIIDEVHMLSAPAFNALLKILEEPPSHVLFILATTELHKISATIRSRCQHFSFKRIAPKDIFARLEYVAEREDIPLTTQGAQMLARLASGGLRDALSLLDQCRDSEKVDEEHILKVLGLAGNLETSQLLTTIFQQESDTALSHLGELYDNGRDISSVLDELSLLSRDLLLLKTAPTHGEALLVGGYDETTLKTLGEMSTAPQLLYILKILQESLSSLSKSKNRRTEGELCILRLCLPSLDESASALSARIDHLERKIEQNYSVPSGQIGNIVSSVPPPMVPPREQAPPPMVPHREQAPPPMVPHREQVPPPMVPPREQVPPPMVPPREQAPPPMIPPREQAPPPVVANGTMGSSSAHGGETSQLGEAISPHFWQDFMQRNQQIPRMARSYLINVEKTNAYYTSGRLTIIVDRALTKQYFEKPILKPCFEEALSKHYGTSVVSIAKVGTINKNFLSDGGARANPVPEPSPLPPISSTPLQQMMPPPLPLKEVEPVAQILPPVQEEYHSYMEDSYQASMEAEYQASMMQEYQMGGTMEHQVSTGDSLDVPQPMEQAESGSLDSVPWHTEEEETDPMDDLLALEQQFKN